ncbi:MAG: hypothetical protein GY854_27160 [Deltaproteobacteria bacterium]|nr:hypothetical protein [Deltaproteobacteria bacterium]
MRRTVVFLLAVMLVGLCLVACDDDDDGGNDCEKAANVMLQGMKDACADETECCYCDCIVSGSSSLEGCDCTADGSGGGDSGGEEAKCEGAALDAAQVCLDDTSTCKSQAGASVVVMCMF